MSIKKKYNVHPTIKQHGPSTQYSPCNSKNEVDEFLMEQTLKTMNPLGLNLPICIDLTPSVMEEDACCWSKCIIMIPQRLVND